MPDTPTLGTSAEEITGAAAEVIDTAHPLLAGMLFELPWGRGEDKKWTDERRGQWLGTMEWIVDLLYATVDDQPNKEAKRLEAKVRELERACEELLARNDAAREEKEDLQQQLAEALSRIGNLERMKDTVTGDAGMEIEAVPCRVDDCSEMAPRRGRHAGICKADMEDLMAGGLVLIDGEAYKAEQSSKNVWRVVAVTGGAA